MTKTSSKTIVFITGAFVSSACWDQWKEYYKQFGFVCMAPPWPFKDAPAVELRKRHPDKQVASIRLSGLVEYYADLIKTLPEKPILVGHSMGGLIVQLLLQRNLATAGIAIHPVAPQGVFTFSFSMLRAVWGPLGYFTSTKKTFLMTLQQWQYAFTNGMPYAAQVAGYELFAIPESKLVSRDGLTSVAHIDFRKPHPPLLITSGSTDHIVPASLNYANYKKYKNKYSVTSYKEFDGRNHFVLGQPTWKEDAAYINNWITGIQNA